MAYALVLLALIGAAVAKPVGNTSNCETANQLIAEAEGFRACTYVDTTGHKTICYGFNLETSGAQAKVQAVGGNWDSVYNHGGCLTTSQCSILLNDEVRSAASQELAIFGNQCACINAVLTDMTYNLGGGGMASFGTFISLIKQHKWSSAASDIRGTLWCRQVGNRCSRDAGIIAAGC
jgi:lysozyme